MRARGKKRELIYCKCGCGETLIGMDSKGRNRKFIHGHNKGHNMPHSKETADKMRILRLGKKCSIEIRIKMSLSAKKGSENNNWKGGTTKEADKIRKSIEYKFWRESVFERDNYTCVECSEKESVSGKLNADHIKPFAYFPEMRFDINNGRTLCVECHKKTDTYLKKAQLKYPELHKLLKTA